MKPRSLLGVGLGFSGSGALLGFSAMFFDVALPDTAHAQVSPPLSLLQLTGAK